MLRILICCGGGFSSSALAVKVQKEITQKGLNDEVEANFLPFSMAVRDFDGYDIIMVCPHQKYQVKEYDLKYVHGQIPIYLLPPRIYGTMELDTLLEDANDLISIFKENPHNPVHFPNEEDVMKIKRAVSYKKY